MLPLLCSFFLLFGHSLATNTADQYMDNLLNGAYQTVIQEGNLEPAPLSNYTHEYVDDTSIGKVNAKVEYFVGTVSGLSRVRRHFTCEGPKNTSASTKITCSLVFDWLNVNHEGKIKYGILPKVTVLAKGRIKSTYVGVEVMKPLNKSPHVEINYISGGRVEPEVSGLGALYKQKEVLEKDYGRQAEKEIVEVINKTFREALETAANRDPMPLS